VTPGNFRWSRVASGLPPGCSKKGAHVSTHSFRTWGTLSALALACMAAPGQPSATQRLVIEVKPVARLAVSADPLPLIVTGSDGAATDASGKYDIVTNIRTMRITASIDRPMPEGTSLAIRLESSKGLSRGSVDISQATASADVVTAIAPGAEQGERITYTFSAAGVTSGVDSQSRVVTLTLTE